MNIGNVIAHLTGGRHRENYIVSTRGGGGGYSDLGLEYITQDLSVQNDNNYKCDSCESYMNIGNVIAHLTGGRHHDNYIESTGDWGGWYMYSDFVPTGCAADAAKPIPTFRGTFSRKGYPYLGIYSEHFPFLSKKYQICINLCLSQKF